MSSSKVAVITGSNRGIGLAVAKEFAKNGYRIVLNGRSYDRLEKSLLVIKSLQKESCFCCSDVSTEAGAKQLIDYAIDSFGRIDVLINNVGISSRGTVAETAPSVIKQIMESNIYGTVFPTIYAIPEIRKTAGSIVFVSSLAGISGLPYLAPYSASKMALRAFAESIRIEERANNIHVGLVLVGATEIEQDKKVIASDGTFQLLSKRSEKNVLSMASVAKTIFRNTKKRKFLSTMTRLGKINLLLQAIAPKVVYYIISFNIHKFKNEN